MANYTTNNFFAQTENEKDLITIEQFIEENFCDNYIAKHDRLMYKNNEEQSDIIGKSCTLLNPYKGYTEGTVVGDYGDRIIVSLTSGKEISEYRDEVIIYE